MVFGSVKRTMRMVGLVGDFVTERWGEVKVEREVE